MGTYTLAMDSNRRSRDPDVRNLGSNPRPNHGSNLRGILHDWASADRCHRRPNNPWHRMGHHRNVVGRLNSRSAPCNGRQNPPPKPRMQRTRAFVTTVKALPEIARIERQQESPGRMAIAM